MALRRKKKRDIMGDDFLLKENPFAAIDIYNIDAKHTYVPEIYGDQHSEFLEKFFLSPLENERHKQIIGALWSTHSGGKWGKGFGKSMLMAEEAKRINLDMGKSMLESMDVVDKDIDDNPVLAGYCSFDTSKGINSFPATLLEAVAYILESTCNGSNVHLELRNQICEKFDVEEGYEGESIRRELMKKLNQYRGLPIQLTHHTLRGFIQRLCHNDTHDLVAFIHHEIGPRIKATQGFNFIHVFNAFVTLAGISYVVYFIDQVENFSRFARNKERDIKIIRESICQTSPTADISSFIFQMHIHAFEEIESWWNIEHLPSLDVEDRRNFTRIVNLKGLKSDAAKTLAKRYLREYRIDGEDPEDELHPFSDEIVGLVNDNAQGNPRDFLRMLGTILTDAKMKGRSIIDLTYVEPFLDKDYEDEEPEEEDEFENPDR